MKVGQTPQSQKETDRWPAKPLSHTNGADVGNTVFPRALPRLPTPRTAPFSFYPSHICHSFHPRHTLGQFPHSPDPSTSYRPEVLTPLGNQRRLKGRGLSILSPGLLFSLFGFCQRQEQRRRSKVAEKAKKTQQRQDLEQGSSLREQPGGRLERGWPQN